MKTINFLDLAEKLVDPYDLADTLAFIQKAIGDVALSISGPGVQITPGFLSPFGMHLDGSALSGSVDAGLAVDDNGQLIVVPTSANPFTLEAAHPTYPRLDQLVLRYDRSGERLVARPSEPLTNVFFYLNDSFSLGVIPGVPATTPVYSAKQPGEVILAGIRVPAGATKGTDCQLDLERREVGYMPAAKFKYDVSAFRYARATSAQGFGMAIDDALSEGAALIADTGLDHDRATVTCNSGGVAGDTLTLGGVTLTVDPAGATGPAPQADAAALAYLVASLLRRRVPAVNAVASAGRIALSAKLSGPQGIALGAQGTTFGLSSMALGGNGARKYATASSLKAQVTQLDAAVFSAASPGSIKMWPSTNIEPGWAELYSGRSLVRAENPVLFSIFGTQYGAADAAHFNLPNFAGRFPRVYDPTGTVDVDAANRVKSIAIGASGNNGNVIGNTLEDQFKSHSHSYHAPLDQGGAGGGAGPRAVYTDNTDFTGGLETRPKDFILAFVIKLG